jgi:prepilin-type N-terminal cleavage/methylation domain-containing protein
MNFKRAFTLVEMIIVLIIISIVFLALGLISWSYVTKLNLENDKETLDGVFSYVQSTSLSQAVYKNWKLFDYLWMQLISNYPNIILVWFTWSLTKSNLSLLENKVLNYTKVGSKFFIYSWDNTLIDSFSWKAYFVFKSYNLWAYFIKQTQSLWQVFTGNKLVKFSISKKNYKKCFSFNLNSGRLFETNCN